jgi:hypothetical protein
MHNPKRESGTLVTQRKNVLLKKQLVALGGSTRIPFPVIQ